MSLKYLASKVEDFRKKLHIRINVLEKELEEADEVFDKLDKNIEIKEIFTAANAPDRIKKLPKKLQEVWISTFNSVFSDSKDEEKAFRVANSQIKKVKESGDPEDLEEAAPEGSFEAMRDLTREALKNSSIFPKEKTKTGEIISGPWLRYMFLDKIIVEFKNKNFEVPIINKNGSITFGKPKEVVETFKIKEGESKSYKNIEINEANITITGKSENVDFDSGYISLKEAKYDEKSGDIEVVIIEAGTNDAKRRHYPVKTIQEAGPIFSGLKMYLNHPTKKEEQERPERDITKWASTIVESRAEGGKAIGKVSVHNSWLRESLKDPVFRQHVGLSINMGGQVSMGRVNGKQMQIVEKIFRKRQNGPASVDWVTEPGARGRVNKLVESNRKENEMEFKDLTLKEIQEQRPDLLEAHTKSIKDGKVLEKTQAELKEANEKIAEFERTQKAIKQKEMVAEILKESKGLNEVSKKRVQKLAEATLYETEKELKEAVAGFVKEETAYLNQLSTKGKIKLGSDNTNDKTLVESHQEELEGAMGLKEEKKEDE